MVSGSLCLTSFIKVNSYISVVVIRQRPRRIAVTKEGLRANYEGIRAYWEGLSASWKGFGTILEGLGAS